MLKSKVFRLCRRIPCKQLKDLNQKLMEKKLHKIEIEDILHTK